MAKSSAGLVLMSLLALPLPTACTTGVTPRTIVLCEEDRRLLREEDRRLLRGATYRLLHDYQGQPALKGAVDEELVSLAQRVFADFVCLRPYSTAAHGEALTVKIQSMASALSATYSDGKQHFTGVSLSGTISLERRGMVYRREFSGTRPPIFSHMVQENTYLTPADAGSQWILRGACKRPRGFYSVLIEMVAEVFGWDCFLPLLKEAKYAETSSSNQALCSGLISLGRWEFRRPLADFLLDALENVDTRRRAAHVLLNILEDGAEGAHSALSDALALFGGDEAQTRIGLRATREATEARLALGADRRAWGEWWNANSNRLLKGITRD